MGGEPWSVFTAFEPSVEAALEKARERIFEAGEYRGAELEPESIDEALENSAEEGTASILDIFSISPTPEFCAASPIDPERAKALFGTERPTREAIEANDGYFEGIGRGEAIYIVVYRDEEPDSYFFAGYSVD